MAAEDQDFRSAHEIGKIYDALTERSALCDFFLESVCNFIHANQGWLFMVGKDDQVWLEARHGVDGDVPDLLRQEAQDAVRNGKPIRKEKNGFRQIQV